MSALVEGVELDWFAFETRVRKLIHELIEPTSKRFGVLQNHSYVFYTLLFSECRSVHTREQNEDLRKQHEALKRKVEDLGFILHQNQSRSTAFDELHKRISEAEAARSVLETRLEQVLANVARAQENVNEKLLSIEVECGSFVISFNDKSFL